MGGTTIRLDCLTSRHRHFNIKKMAQSTEQRAQGKTNESEVIKRLQDELRREQIKVLTLRMYVSVLIQHPKGAAAEKISRIARVDFSESIVHLN